MKTIKWPYKSYGTIYGTVSAYDTDGNITGAQNIIGYGIFFVVKDNFDPSATLLFRKSIGTGITVSNGSSGLFTITIQTTDVKWTPRQYYYGAWINPSGTLFVEGTTGLKSIGSGIFEIMKGVQYGTVN